MLTGWLLVVFINTADRYQIVGLAPTLEKCQLYREKLLVHVFKEEQKNMRCVPVEEARRWK